jgi:hypothetical protein
MENLPKQVSNQAPNQVNWMLEATQVSTFNQPGLH